MQQKNEMSKDEAYCFAMSIATGPSLYTVLKAAIELDVFEIINRVGSSGSHLSPAQIVAQLANKGAGGANSTLLDRMLWFLANNDVVSHSTRTLPDGRVQRVYGPTRVSEFFTKDQSPGALLLLGMDKVYTDAWHHLKDAVLDSDVAFHKAHNMSHYEYIETDTRFGKLFNDTMSTYSAIVVEKILENYDGFNGVFTLVDVGGGIGVTLNMIVSKYPAISGINYDLPHVIKNAPVHNGVKHVAGDMFVCVTKGDAIFMKWICHNWSDEHCIKFLRNCYDALFGQGKVIICDYVLPETPKSDHCGKVAFNFDAKMMVNSIGGKERTKQEFESLAKQAGFEGFKVACSTYEYTIMEFLKNI